MVTYRGYNSIKQEKKFTLTDFDLVVRDFINTMHIRQGEIVGKPDVGSMLWNYIFEPKTQDVVAAIYREVERLASLDPRLAISDLQLYSANNAVILELSAVVTPSVDPRSLMLVFDELAKTVTYRER